VTGTSISPYGAAYRRAHGSSTCGLFKQSLCSPSCGWAPRFFFSGRPFCYHGGALSAPFAHIGGTFPRRPERRRCAVDGGHCSCGRRHGSHPTPYTPHPAPCTLHPAPYTLHPAPYTLHPAPCVLHPKLSTLHPAFDTLHPAPCTRHPSPYTLNATGVPRTQENVHLSRTPTRP
jgi:hypothetical protein